MLTEEMNIAIERRKASRLAEVDFDNLVFGTVFSDHMLMSDYDGQEWRDTRIVPFGDISLSPSVSSLHYGQAIFEGMKAYRDAAGEVVLFRPSDNWRRLNRSAARMCMPQVPEDLFMDGLRELVRLDSRWVSAREGHSLYIRPLLIASDGALGVRPSKTYRFLIITGPVNHFFSEPVRVRIETEYSRACEGGVGFAKAAGNYGGAMYPQMLAQSKGYHQVIWTDAKEHRYIEEAGAMNVMFVLGGKLVTGPAGGTILEGITRDSILALARDMGVEVEERKITVKEVIDGIAAGTLEEAFGVGTAATVAPIATIGLEGTDHNLPARRSDALSARLADALNAIRSGRAEDKYGWMVKV